MINEEVQFSIYKISNSLVIDTLDGLTNSSDSKNILDKLIYYIECCVKKVE